VVIGGGIYGAALVWEAVLRGLSAALVEKGDFGGAASAHSLKTIHGGLRYLQSGDIRRVRESSHERHTLMRIAPHLVYPLPCIVPTYGHGMRSREVMRIAMLMNDLITFDRNRDGAAEKAIPPGRVLSVNEVLTMLPGIDERGLTGGALYHDAQVYHSERLTLAFVQSAARKGADALNYAQVVGFLRNANAVTGVQVRDQLTGAMLDIRARLVISAAGAWTSHLLSLLNGKHGKADIQLAKAVNVVTTPLFARYAVGLSDPGDKRRLYFVSPWRGCSMIGTTYTLYNDDPDILAAAERDAQTLLNIVNRSYPARQLRMDDVTFIHRGLLPVKGVSSTGEVSLLQHPRIIDYRAQGTTGLLSIEGVKYTTARDVAQRGIDAVFRAWGKQPPHSTSASTPLHGGEIASVESCLHDAYRANPWHLKADTLERLIRTYGSAYTKVLEYVKTGDVPPGDTDLIRAEVVYAVDHEMGVMLTDVIFRRTELGTARQPEREVLLLCAQTMADKLGWSHERIQQEISECDRQFVWKGETQ
jgi:glycerol-3-phosphate dehydrogenase